METQELIINAGDDLIWVNGEQLSRLALREQLERLATSRHFRNSKRYPSFLRFVVEQTLVGKADVLKERTLGIDVFARDTDYDTNADPIVRVTAGEVRKRIAQYYQELDHEHELRIVLPLGSYVPQFLSAGHAVHVPEERMAAPVVLLPPVEQTSESPAAGVELPPPHVESRPKLGDWRRISLLAGAVVLILLLLIGWTSWRASHRNPGLRMMWQSSLASPNPVLNVIGVHSLDSRGKEKELGSHASLDGTDRGDMLDAMVRSDMVPVSDIVSYSRVTDLLTRRSHAYTTMGAADATLENVRNGPVVLIGGLDNIWTLRLTSKLRFHFEALTHSESSIVDSEHPERRWSFDNLQRPIGSTRDYAIVASYFDSTIEQPVVIVAGIGKAGTEAASEFMTSEQAIQTWLKRAPMQPNQNVELVLQTDILDARAGPPHVIASATW